MRSYIHLAFIVALSLWTYGWACAETKINLATQADWTTLTGSGPPTSGLCVALNYGMPYTDVANNIPYLCTPAGWLQTNSGGGAVLQTNNQNNALQNLLNFSTSTVNSAGLVVTPFNPVGGVERFEITGTYIGTISSLQVTSALGYFPTNAAVVPSGLPGPGQLLIGNAGGTAYAAVTLGGDANVNSAGVVTVTKSNGAAFGSAAFTASSAYDVAGAAAARAGTGACPANQYADNITPGGLSCAPVAYAQVSGTPTLGTIASQNASAVAITGGSVDGTTIGATTPAAGTFASLKDTGAAAATGNYCLQIDTLGNLSNTGSPCGTGGGGGMTWPGSAGIAVYAGSNAWGTSLAAPTGTIVGTTDTQTLTNKTLDGVTPATMAFLDATSSIQTQLNGKQAALGYTPTNAAVVPSTVPSAGQLLVGNAGGTAYAPVTLGGDGTISSAGVLTVTKSNGTTFGTAAFDNTGTSGDNIPLLNGNNTYSGTANFSNATVQFSGLTGLPPSGNYCLHVSATGVLSTTGADCGSGSGAVSSVSNVDGSLTVTPTTGAVVASLNTANANSWSALQTFGTHVSIGGVTAAGATGTSNVVFSNSPTLVTPVLGTPTSGVITNLTGTCLACTANAVANALTFDASGAGVAPGSTYNGSAAVLVSYNSVGAAPALGATVSETSSFNVLSGVNYKFTGASAANATLPATVTGFGLATVRNAGTGTLTVLTGGPTYLGVATIPPGYTLSFVQDGTNFDNGSTPVITYTGLTFTAGSTGNTLALAAPTASVLGGLLAQSGATSNSWVQYVDTTGTQHLTQPTLANIAAGASSSGTYDFSGATQVKLPVAAGYASAANGECGYDSTNLNWHCWQSAADNFVAVFPVGAPPASGHVVGFLKSISSWSLQDLGAPTISGIALGSNLGTLTFGTHLAAGGSSYNGSAGVTITSDAASINTASTIVARDSSGNFSAGTITASLAGNASTATSATSATSATTATNLAGTGVDYAPYQSASATTGYIAAPVTSGHTFVYAWQPSGAAVAPTAVDANTLVVSSANTSTTATNLAGTTVNAMPYQSASGTTSYVGPGATAGVPLIAQGSSSAPIFGTALVAGGGTGLTSATAYAPLLGGTTSTGAFQSAVAGTSGQVFVSQGSATKPTYIDFPERYYVPAANCNNTTAGAGWSIGSSGVVACRAGTNNQGGAVQITDTAATFAQFAVTIPVDWDTATNPYIRFYFGVVTDTTNGHTVIPQIKVSCPTAGNGTTSDDATFSAAQSSSTVTLGASAVANGFYNGSNVQIGSTQMTGCIAGGLMLVQVGRATDTVTGNVNFYGADLTFPRQIVVQAN